MKILVIDDSEQLGRTWATNISAVLPEGSGNVVEHLHGQPVLDTLRTLRERRSSCRTGAPDFETPCLFDDVDVLVVDYELWELDPDQQISGEELSYLARAFSRCGLIIGVNQGEHRDAVFDLTLREIHPELFADVMVHSSLLREPGLWLQPTGNSFRPWSWPNIAGFATALKQNVANIVNNLDQPLLGFCKLDGQLENLTPRERGFFAPLELDENLTLRQVAKSAIGFRGKDGDTPPPDEYVARVVASRMMCWLSKVICQESSWLIDIPHLAVECPEAFVQASLDGDASRLCRLEMTAMDYLQNEVRAAKWDSMLQIDRPLLERQRAIGLAQQAGLTAHGDTLLGLVFCEDVSGFRLRDSAIEYLTDLEGDARWRWVTNPQCAGIHYHPRSLLAV